MSMLSALLLAVIGCSGSAPPADEPVSAPPGLMAPDPPVPDDAFPTDPVQVAAAGTRFDPPVSPKAIPDGAYYCDMGFVHYAQLEEGDGKCPVCGMNLSHKEAGAAKAGENEAHDGHEGHDH